MGFWDWVWGKKGDAFAQYGRPPVPPYPQGPPPHAPDAALPAPPPLISQPASQPRLPRLDTPATGIPVGGALGYSIEDAIELVRALPIEENPELVLRVVRKTLRSTKVSVEDIIISAERRESTLSESIEQEKTAIEDLDRRIAERRSGVERLRKQLDETRSVRERLEEAIDGESRVGASLLQPPEIAALQAQAAAAQAARRAPPSLPSSTPPLPLPAPPPPPSSRNIVTKPLSKESMKPAAAAPGSSTSPPPLPTVGAPPAPKRSTPPKPAPSLPSRVKAEGPLASAATRSAAPPPLPPSEPRLSVKPDAKSEVGPTPGASTSPPPVTPSEPKLSVPTPPVPLPIAASPTEEPGAAPEKLVDPSDVEDDLDSKKKRADVASAPDDTPRSEAKSDGEAGPRKMLPSVIELDEGAWDVTEQRPVASSDLASSAKKDD